MGSDCALLAIACYASARLQPRRAGLYWVGVVLALLLVLMTRSRTALLAGAAGLVTVAALLAGRRTRALIVLGGIAAGAAGVALGGDLQSQIAESLAMGRTDVGASDIASFTGRSEIWAQLWGFVRERPVFGYGYNSFWTPARLLDVALQQGFTSPSAHSGLLEVTLGLGIVGGGIFAVILLSAVLRAAQEYRRSRDVEAAFVAAALLMLCVNISTESIVLAPTIGSFIWMMMLARLGFIQPAPWYGGKGDAAHAAPYVRQ